jgi:hypothetical protein
MTMYGLPSAVVPDAGTRGSPGSSAQASSAAWRWKSRTASACRPSRPRTLRLSTFTA